jgi:hypothetical protein
MIFDKMQRIKNILRTKLNKPPVLDDYVHRVRLIEKFSEDSVNPCMRPGGIREKQFSELMVK